MRRALPSEVAPVCELLGFVGDGHKDLEERPVALLVLELVDSPDPFLEGLLHQRQALQLHLLVALFLLEERLALVELLLEQSSHLRDDRSGFFVLLQDLVEFRSFFGSMGIELVDLSL